MRSGREDGFTLIEVAIVTMVVGVLTTLIVQSLADLARSQAYTQGQTRIAQGADLVMRGIVRDVTFSSHVFSDGGVGDGYLSAMDYPVAEVAPDSRLPLLTQRGYFDIDPAGELETGNLLFVARSQRSLLVDVSGGGTPDERRVDTATFVIYSLNSKLPDGFDLSRWSSVPVARHKDIMGLETVAQRTAALTALYAADVRYSWDAGRPAEEGLFVITSSGQALALPVSAKIPTDPSQTRSGIISQKNAVIAPNGRVGGLNVPGYAEVTSAGFPGGFELKLDGPTSGKLLMLRLVMMRGRADSRANSAEVLRLVSCADG
ncbi:MAG: prepilin-type N-terminal cleavage/methylation domain-containing protein [Planctomycetota bacterium]